MVGSDFFLWLYGTLYIVDPPPITLAKANRKIRKQDIEKTPVLVPCAQGEVREYSFIGYMSRDVMVKWEDVADR